MQRGKKPLNPFASLILLIVLVILGVLFLALAFIGFIANPWGVLAGILFGTILYYVRRC